MDPYRPSRSVPSAGLSATERIIYLTQEGPTPGPFWVDRGAGEAYDCPMTCATCHAETSRLRIAGGKERCHACGGFAESGGARLDGTLSRQRVRMDAAMHEGDVVNPWQYDRPSRSFVPNGEFLRRHAASAHNFMGPEDVARSHPALAARMRAKDARADDGQGRGDFAKEAERVIKQA